MRVVSERRDKAAAGLEGKLRTALLAGSFVAHAEHRPVSEINADLGEACKIYLGTAAAECSIATVKRRFRLNPARLKSS